MRQALAKIRPNEETDPRLISLRDRLRAMNSGTVHTKAAIKALVAHGPLTTGEVGELCSLRPKQAAACLNRLRRSGAVVTTGTTRRTPSGRMATVWALARVGA